MPQNHRGEDIGGHNHANIVNAVRQTIGTDNDTFTAYKDPSDPNRAYSSVVYPSDDRWAVEAATSDGKSFGSFSDTGVYRTEDRAIKAGHALNNRFARTGSYGIGQSEIQDNRAARKKAEDDAVIDAMIYGRSIQG